MKLISDELRKLAEDSLGELVEEDRVWARVYIPEAAPRCTLRRAATAIHNLLRTIEKQEKSAGSVTETS